MEAHVRPPAALCERKLKMSSSQSLGKFEVLGTTVVSLLLTGGALGIGFHSYSLLLESLAPALASLGPGPAPGPRRARGGG